MGNITFLGVEGSGKTVLTMALVNAFKAHEDEGWFLRPETRGAFRFLEQVPSELKEGTLPHQTTSLRHLAWSVVKDGEHQQTLDILDYPGEVYRLAFLNAEDEADPEEFRARVQAHQAEIKALLGHLIHSEHIFVLFNLADSSDLAGNAKNLDAVWVTNACLDYLHRLPHKPRITLLLTQIDKYVDLEQYELDPKVYYTRHLSLIAHNFPQLDVCAVAALGAADATFGIDSILIRSLFKTPKVQSVLREVRETRRAWQKLLKNHFSKQHFRILFDATKRLASDNPYWKESLPWFIKPESLCSSNGLMTVDASFEILTSMRDLYTACEMSQSEVDLNQVLYFLNTLECQHKEASDFFGVINVALQEQVAIAKQQEEHLAVLDEQKQKREKIAEQCCYISGGIFVLSIIFIIGLCTDIKLPSGRGVWKLIGYGIVGVFVFIGVLFEMIKEKINTKK